MVLLLVASSRVTCCLVLLGWLMCMSGRLEISRVLWQYSDGKVSLGIDACDEPVLTLNVADADAEDVRDSAHDCQYFQATLRTRVRN